MAHDVFISYSSRNAEYANAVHEKLESNGIKCWIDVNSIRTANNFAQEIIDGLNEAKVVVLIYSKDSDESKYVYREIETAFDNIPIVPLKIDDTFPDNLEFFLRNTQWLDASPTALEKKNITIEDCYDDLVEAVKAKMKDNRTVVDTGDKGIVIEQEKTFLEKYGKLLAVAVILLVVVGGFLAYNGMNNQSGSEDLNETGIEIGYIGLQDNGGTYSYNVYGNILEGTNASDSDVIHIDFYDKNAKKLDSSDTKVGEATGNILGSVDLSDDDVSKVSVELQNKDKKVLYTAESDNVVSE